MLKRTLWAGALGTAVMAVGSGGGASVLADGPQLPPISSTAERQPIPEGSYLTPAAPAYRPAPIVQPGTTIYNPDGSVTYYPQQRYYTPPYQYYGGPLVGFQRYPYGGSIHLGPLHFGWR